MDPPSFCSLCVCVCVLALQATVFNLELWKLEWILLLANPKFVFFLFFEKVIFGVSTTLFGFKNGHFAPQKSHILDFGPNKSQTIINISIVVWLFQKISTWQILTTHFQGWDLWPWPLNDLERSVFQHKWTKNIILGAVLQENHTSQGFENGRIASRLSLRFERAQHQIPAMYGYLVIP